MLPVLGTLVGGLHEDGARRVFAWSRWEQRRPAARRRPGETSGAPAPQTRPSGHVDRVASGLILAAIAAISSCLALSSSCAAGDTAVCRTTPSAPPDVHVAEPRSAPNA